MSIHDVTILAMDARGLLYLVALTDDVGHWHVEVERTDGSRSETPALPFPGGEDVELTGRPSWFIDDAEDWTLTVDKPAGTTPEPVAPDMPDASWAEEAVRNLAQGWLDDPARPRLTHESAAVWRGLVDEWVTGRLDLPLPIRGGATGRRGSLKTLRGLEVVFVDNSPAQWIFARSADEGWTPSTDELAAAVRSEMPVAFTLTKNELKGARFTVPLSRVASTMSLGFSLHHIEPVSVKRTRPEKLMAKELRESARRLLDPTNMFVLPKSLAGLGELPAFINVMRTEHH